MDQNPGFVTRTSHNEGPVCFTVEGLGCRVSNHPSRTTFSHSSGVHVPFRLFQNTWDGLELRASGAAPG